MKSTLLNTGKLALAAFACGSIAVLSTTSAAAEGAPRPAAVEAAKLLIGQSDAGAVAAKILKDQTSSVSEETEKMGLFFRLSSALTAGVSESETGARSAVAKAIVKEAQGMSDDINKSAGRDGDLARDTLVQSYSLAFAAVGNVLGDSVSEILPAMLEEVPEALRPELERAAKNPQSVLGRRRALVGRSIGNEVRARVLEVADPESIKRKLTFASTTTTTTTTSTTTTTTRGRIAAVSAPKPAARKPVVKPTRPSPTPVGLR